MSQDKKSQASIALNVTLALNHSKRKDVTKSPEYIKQGLDHSYDRLFEIFMKVEI